MNYAPSLRFLFRPTHPFDHQQYKLIYHCGFADNVSYNSSLPPLFPLPDSQREQQEWEADLRLHGEALAATFLREAPRYQIVEVFTHAYTDTDHPEQLGLFFEGDSVPQRQGFIVNAATLQSMELRARLCLLIGCGTGTGKYLPGEGVQSLAQRFAYIGSDNVVSTLWATNQDPARRFLDVYNATLAVNPYPGSALQRSKIQLLDDAGTANREKHPSQWASFIMMGAGEPLASLASPPSSYSWLWWCGVALLLCTCIVVFRVRKQRLYLR